MAEVLLVGRMAMLPLQEVLLTLADLSVIVGLLVVVEVARRAFAGVQRSLWIVNTAGLLVVAGLVLAFWGPWPASKDLAWDSTIGKLHLMQFAAQKGNSLVALLTVELGLLVVIFGRHFKAGWRSHTQMIAIGLSTVAVAFLSAQGVVQFIIRTAHPQSRAEVDRILGLITQAVERQQDGVHCRAAVVDCVAVARRAGSGCCRSDRRKTLKSNVSCQLNVAALPDRAFPGSAGGTPRRARRFGPARLS